jgi:hypothetical protein
VIDMGRQNYVHITKIIQTDCSIVTFQNNLSRIVSTLLFLAYARITNLVLRK